MQIATHTYVEPESVSHGIVRGVYFILYFFFTNRLIKRVSRKTSLATRDEEESRPGGAAVSILRPDPNTWHVLCLTWPATIHISITNQTGKYQLCCCVPFVVRTILRTSISLSIRRNGTLQKCARICLLVQEDFCLFSNFRDSRIFTLHYH